jgi:hypothetical protein
MKIETNFTAPVHALAARIALAIWIVALVLAGGIIALWLDGSATRTQIGESTERLAQLEVRRAALGKQPDTPSAVEIAALRGRVATVNALSVTGGRRLVPLLALFEELLPADAWLVTLSHKARDGEVILVAEAAQAEQLTQFLLNLEKSTRFSEVLLSRQTPIGTEGRRAVQFELRLKERR